MFDISYFKFFKAYFVSIFLNNVCMLEKNTCFLLHVKLQIDLEILNLFIKTHEALFPFVYFIYHFLRELCKTFLL
jgi:hypothetical protein